MQLLSLIQEDLLEEEIARILQYSCLENPMDRGAWWATARGIAELYMTEQLSMCEDLGLSLIWEFVPMSWE